MKRLGEKWTAEWIDEKLRSWGVDPAEARGMLEAERLQLRSAETVGVCLEDVNGQPCDGQWRVIDKDGATWEVKCDECGFEAGVPAQDPEGRLKHAIKKAGLPTRFIDTPLEIDQHNKAALTACNEYVGFFPVQKVPAPALWGNVGRGKSHMLVNLCVRLMRERKATVFYRPMRMLLNEFQQFDDEFERNHVWHRALTVDVLALDDVGSSRVSEWREDQIADLIDQRYQANKPIVLATNFPPDMWDGMVDPRTASRLGGMTNPLRITGPDRRRGGQ